MDALGPDETAGDEEAREFVCSQKGLGEERVTGDPPDRVVGRDGVGDLVLPQLLEPGHDAGRMLLGPSLVVGIVQQSGDAPLLLVLPVLASQGTHRDLDAPCVAQEALGRGHLMQQGNGLVMLHHEG